MREPPRRLVNVDLTSFKHCIVRSSPYIRNHQCSRWYQVAFAHVFRSCHVWQG
jgi:hypothetical protein